VIGLDPLLALCVIPTFVWAVAKLATHGVHGSSDVIVAVAVGVLAISLAGTLVVRWRARVRGDRTTARQDWLLTVFVIALTALLLIPDDASDRTIWAWTPGVVIVVTGLLLATREVRRRRGARRLS